MKPVPLRHGVPQAYNQADSQQRFGKIEDKFNLLGSAAGAAEIGVVQSGSGAIAENQQSRGRWTVLATDYLSDADRALVRAGTTVALDTALGNAATYLATLGGGKIRIPAGNYSLDGYNPTTDIEIEGDGYEATLINQASAANPAYHADATAGTLKGIAFKNLQVVGHASATVAAVRLEANTPYTIHDSEFDYKATSTYSPLEMICTASDETYNLRIKVNSDTSTTKATTKGAYNGYDLNLVKCGDGLALTDSTVNPLYMIVVADGQVQLSGSNFKAKIAVETIYASSSSAAYAIDANGSDYVLDTPTVANVTSSKLSTGIAIRARNYGVVSEPHIYGTNVPQYPFALDSTSKLAFQGGNATGITFAMRAYISEAILNAQQFIGDCSSYLGGSFTKLPKLRYNVVPSTPAATLVSGGTDTTPVAGTIYLSELWITEPKSLTWIGVLNGSVAGTDKYLLGLFDSDGNLVKNTLGAGTTTSGTSAFQEIAFTAAYVAVPGRYWIGVQLNGTTDRFVSIAANTYNDVKTKSSTGTFGTLPTQTVPTTFTADVGPIAYVY